MVQTSSWKLSANCPVNPKDGPQLTIQRNIVQRGSSKSAHAWISIIFCMLNTYVITPTKMKLFYSLKAVRPQWGTLMYTLFELIYDLLNTSLKSLALLTATFYEWNLKEDSPGYTLLPLMYMNRSISFFPDQSEFELSPF